MIVYKYKSLEKMKYIRQILSDEKLYAATFTELNDVMEGAFTSNKNIKEEYKNFIREEKGNIYICSLSKSPDNPLLWAYYANGFKGICIEIEINNNIVDGSHIEYNNHTPRIYKDDHKYTIAKKLLSRKYTCWRMEDEYRLFSKTKDITQGFKIKGIYLGVRISNKDRIEIEGFVDGVFPIYRTEVKLGKVKVALQSQQQNVEYYGNN